MSDVIRNCTLDDAAALAAIYDPIVAATIISFEEVPPGPREMQRRIASGDDAYPWLVFERDGSVYGYVYASRHSARAAYRWSVDVSAYVAPALRRQGIAARLYAQLFAILIEQGYCAAFAGVTLPNEASCRLHESVGFTPVGVYHAVGFKAGAWHDVIWYERRLHATADTPREPRPLTAIGRAPGHVLRSPESTLRRSEDETASPYRSSINAAAYRLEEPATPTISPQSS